MHALNVIRYANEAACRRAKTVERNLDIKRAPQKIADHLKRLRSPGHQAELRELVHA